MIPYCAIYKQDIITFSPQAVLCLGYLRKSHAGYNYIRARRSRGQMYVGHARLSVCVIVCLSLAAFPHYCTDPDVTWGMVGGTL